MKTENPLPSDEQITSLLSRTQPLPVDPVSEHIVLWRTFRTIPDAIRFAHAIILGDGQSITGGATEDSLGALHWLGVRVVDLEKWGNTKAIQRNGAFDPESPDVQGRPFERHR